MSPTRKVSMDRCDPSAILTAVPTSMQNWYSALWCAWMSSSVCKCESQTVSPSGNVHT